MYYSRNSADTHENLHSRPPENTISGSGSARVSSLRSFVQSSLDRQREERARRARELSEWLADVDKIATNDACRDPPEAHEQQGIEGHGDSGESVSATNTLIPSLAPTSIPTPTSNPVPTPTKSRTPSSTRPKSRRWRDLDPFQKLQASFEAAERLSGFAFSLNFDIAREGTLWNAADPARSLSHEISRQLRAAIGFVAPYSFVLELCTDEHGYQRLHAHGVLIPGDADPAKIEQALLRAGGRHWNAIGGRKQLDLRQIDNASGWASYTLKAVRWGKAKPTGRFVFVSTPLKQIAKHDYAEFGLSQNIEFHRKRKPNSSNSKLTNNRSDQYKLPETIAYLAGHFSGTDSSVLPQLNRVLGKPRMEIDTYMPEAAYDALIAALVKIKACVLTRELEASEIKIALGEIGNIWPASIRKDQVPIAT